MKTLKRTWSIVLLVIVVALVSPTLTQKTLAANNIVIVIDPGHGGPGTTDVAQLGAVYNGIQEKVATLATAQALYNELSQYGNCTVYLTRTEDKALSLAERVNYAQSVGADVMISVHYNASAEHLFYGGEVFVPSKGQGYATGYGLGACVLEQWTANGAQNKGIKTRIGSNGDYYGVIRLGAAAGIPTIILEHGYIDNSTDFSRVGSQDAWTRMGVLDAIGIANYYGLQKGITKESVEPTVNVAVPTGVVMDDTTPPTGVVLSVDSYDATDGIVNYTLTANDAESKLMYYAVTIGNVPTVTELSLWSGNSVSGTLTVPIGYSGMISARVYNCYEKWADSAAVAVDQPAIESIAPAETPTPLETPVPATMEPNENVVSEDVSADTVISENVIFENVISENVISENIIEDETLLESVSETLTDSVVSQNILTSTEMSKGERTMNIATIAGTVITIVLAVILIRFSEQLSRNWKVFLWSLLVVIALGTLTIFILLAAKRKDLEVESETNPLTTESQNVISEDFADLEELGLDFITEPTPSANEVQTPSENLLAPNEYVINTVSENQITVTFAGDVLFDPGYAIYNNYKNNGFDISKCISPDLLDEMHNADIMMVNNEFPYSLGGAPLEGKTYTFRANPASTQILQEMGVDIVSIANNHAFDYGESAFVDTLTTLEEASMPYVGGGRNIDDACRPIYYIAGDMKIAIIAATQIERFSNPDTRGATDSAPGVFRCYDDPTKLVESIQEAKRNCDFVIVYVHWGTENTDVLDWCQTSQAPLFVEAGADLIIGDHPHCLQEVGYIDGVPIIYSLGNFWFNSKTVDSCIVKATITNGELTTLQFVPCLQSGCGVSMLYGEERMRVIAYMRTISTTAQIDDAGYITP